MVKATGHELRIGDIVLLEKSGGRGGDWRRSP
jgi:molybdenum cofactor biosynthesis enzyme